MAQSNPALLQGDIIETDQLVPEEEWPPMTVAVLTSGWGIEGTYTTAKILNMKIQQLRTFLAYRNERLAVQMTLLDSIV